MTYRATKQRVYNRGVPPDNFLIELVTWGRIAPKEIFVPNSSIDIYSDVFRVPGPWQDLRHRRAVMLEVMRVLAGFECSWNWNEGRDAHNATSVTSVTIQAGAWQVSANSMGIGQELKDLVLAKVGSLEGNAFQRALKQNHMLAMDYIARLLVLRYLRDTKLAPRIQKGTFRADRHRTDPRNTKLFRQNLQLDCGIGGRDRDRTVKGSSFLIGVDHLARIRLGHARHYEFHLGALEYRGSFVLRLSVDHPFHAHFDPLERKLRMLRQPLHHQRRASCNTGQEKLARAGRVAGTVMALAVVDDDMVIPGGPYMTPRYARADSFDAGFKVAISHT
jgi:hypothetical protein